MPSSSLRPALPATYEAALAYLDDHVNLEAVASGRFEAPTLERMEHLCTLLGDPQHDAPVVHVTGTNGKGSTARLTTALLQAHGLAVGTYTSPDLGRVTERISRNGEPIGEADFTEAVAAVAATAHAGGIVPSRFEILTLAALRWFADVAVDAAVVEVGMGGRWDATNVVEAGVAVVTNVGLDHTDVLGPTRADIAGEKAGIVGPKATLVLGEADPALAPIFEATGPGALWTRHQDFGVRTNDVAVGGRLVDLYTPGASYDQLFVPLHGAHQGDNAAAAVAAAEAFFGRPLDPEVVRQGLAGVQVPGRFEVVGRRPLVVLDGAHNPDGCRAAATTLGDFSIAGSPVLVVGMNRGRSPAEMLGALEAAHAGLVVACAVDWPRAVPAAEVAAAARELGAEVEVVPAVGEALSRALAVAGPDDAVLVTGSLHVVGAARSALRP
ncbi:MAG TPA: Mur ligase family protein [Acidimicrobiales bacterium]|nr:Mur ligase family protein [Acidimicrobiales bacterium]